MTILSNLAIQLGCQFLPLVSAVSADRSATKRVCDCHGVLRSNQPEAQRLAFCMGMLAAHHSHSYIAQWYSCDNGL